VAVLLGVAFLGERLSIVKWISVGIAALAVVLLAIGLGVAPWISLVLAVSFALYGLVKKWIDSGPVISVTGEVLILSPVALLWIWGVHFEGWQGVAGRSGGMFGYGKRDSLILMLSAW
jgi:chloramphenicol-sensitive protein RarD